MNLQKNYSEVTTLYGGIDCENDLNGSIGKARHSLMIKNIIANTVSVLKDREMYNME
jgi:hypothetical protein